MELTLRAEWWKKNLYVVGKSDMPRIVITICFIPLLMDRYSNRPSFSKNVNSTPGILRGVITGNFNAFRPNNLDY